MKKMGKPGAGLKEMLDTDPDKAKKPSLKEILKVAKGKSTMGSKLKNVSFKYK